MRRYLPGLCALFMGFAMFVHAAEDEEKTGEELQRVAFSKLVKRYEREMELSLDKRLETIKQFQLYILLPECRRYLVSILPKEEDLTVIRELTQVLIMSGTPETVSAALSHGLLRLDPLVKVSSEPDPMIPDRWTYKTDSRYRMLPMYYFGPIAGTFASIQNDKTKQWILQNGVTGKISQKPLFVKFMISVYGGIDHPSLARTLTGLLSRQRDPQIITAILDAARTAKVTDSGFVRAVMRFLRVRHPDIQLATLLCLEKVAPKQLEGKLPVLLKSASEIVRMLAVDAVIQCNTDVRAVVPLLQDNSWKVRISVYRALGKTASRTHVARLVERLESEEHPRARDDLIDTLIRLTGVDVGRQYPQWQSWWRQHGRTAELKWRDAQELGKIKTAKGETGRTATYYGLNVSNFASFLIDASRSMKEEYEIEVVDRRGAGRTATQDKIVVKKITDEKIQFARKNLKGVLRRLSPRVMFNIFSFAHQADPWKGALVKNTQGNRADAFTFLDSLDPAGSTNMFDTLVLAMKDKKVDTIYILSDGAPTSGRVTEKDAFVEEVRRINMLRKVKINTIGFNLEGEAQELMKELADTNYGTFIIK